MSNYSTLQSVLTLATTSTVVFADAEYLNGTLGIGIRPGPEVWKEVVQIGAVKYAAGEKVASNFCELVRPTVKGETLEQEKWKFFEQLTALHVMAHGRPFEEVWQEFMAFVDGAPIVIMLGDREVYKWSFQLLGKPNDEVIDAMDWIILKPLLGEKFSGYGSGDLYQAVGFTADEVCPNLATHDALFDASSMALFCTHYKV